MHTYIYTYIYTHTCVCRITNARASSRCRSSTIASSRCRMQGRKHACARLPLELQYHALDRLCRPCSELFRWLLARHSDRFVRSCTIMSALSRQKFICGSTRQSRRCVLLLAVVCGCRRCLSLPTLLDRLEQMVEKRVALWACAHLI